MVLMTKDKTLERIVDAVRSVPDICCTQKATICIICQVRIQEPEMSPPDATFPPFLAAGDRKFDNEFLPSSPTSKILTKTNLTKDKELRPARQASKNLNAKWSLRQSPSQESDKRG
jgi:hypothetical protein